MAETLLPYEFDFDAEHGILRCRWQGAATDVTLKEFYSTMARTVRKLHPSAAMLDLSGVTSLEASPKTIEEIAGLAPAVPDPAVPVLVVAPAPAVYGMMRLFQTLGGATRPQLQVVHNVDQAYPALGVKEPKFERVEPSV